MRKLMPKRLLVFLKIASIAAVIATLSFLIKGFEFALLIVLAVIIHEAGHLAVAKLLRVRLTKSQNSFLHLSFKFDFSTSSYFATVAVSLAGALFNLFFAFLTIVFLRGANYHALFFIFSNLSLAIFNLMPISSLDGSGALEAFLSMLISETAAQKTVSLISLIFSASFFLFALYIQMKVGANFSLMIISLIMLCSCISQWSSCRQCGGLP